MLLEINGTDISGYLADGSYQTDQEPIYALRNTDTDGVEHVSILRWRSRLYDVPLKVLSNADALSLYNILTASATLSVKYNHGSLGVVTQNMVIDENITRALLPSNNNKLYWNGGTLAFVQK